MRITFTDRSSKPAMLVEFYHGGMNDRSAVVVADEGVRRYNPVEILKVTSTDVVLVGGRMLTRAQEVRFSQDDPSTVRITQEGGEITREEQSMLLSLMPANPKPSSQHER